MAKYMKLLGKTLLCYAASVAVYEIPLFKAATWYVVALISEALYG